MPAATLLRQPLRTLIVAATVPLALAAIADDVRMRRRYDAARRCPLTGLYGRDVLVEHIDRQLRTGRGNDVHVLVLDGNGLKAVNDTYGHAAGDALIRVYGRSLARWTTSRPGACAARLGGDEFGVAARLPARAALDELAALREQLQQPLALDSGHVIHPTVSIGFARAADLPGEDASRLLRGADKAMYEVKTGRQTFPYRATYADAYAETVNGRRAGRHGAHLPAGAV
ncbi:GGDEF domain-containing protein (plasmid) [Streptomyces sp. NBC_01558]|uniref:GGDEF domain-containing protein n=1 Tax=Streptomyces sp. NBC_01558 TaxID=2975878 RepID=UPI002DDC7E3F|nr:GGDEF domain-containing protein [Streptomyces sp. NBC_01558]WSD82781.1 GGDEF domain-containing protein [Streptomyces sp. NBC_01558]